MVQIDILSKSPRLAASQLTALIDLGGDALLFDKKNASAHPGWNDLRRRRRQEEVKGAYLAVGERPLLYLPAAAAKYWDDHDKVRILAPDRLRAHMAEELAAAVRAHGAT